MSDVGEVSESPGLVYTFYSYKGGVGRSMALANVGVLMALEGHRVLLVDWDLEAPGLEVFFRNAGKLEGDPSSTPGVLDLLDAQAEGRSLSWKECLLSAKVFGHSLDIISSGRRTDDYRQRVQHLNWETLFSEHRIGNYINALREEWRLAYDFILIDSRTGITDIGDICTVILPDVLVLLFVTNHQNVDGINGVITRARTARSKLPINRGKLIGVPVPARDERDRESDRFEEWKRIFAEQFGDLYRDWLPRTVPPSDALHRIYIPYVAGWSFGERLPVVESERERSDPSSLGAAYARLATLLSHSLDWTALDAGASTADVVGQRAELFKAREDAREAEARREAEIRVEAEKRLELEAQLEEARLAARRFKRRSWLAAVLAVLLLWFGYRYFSSPSPARLIADLESAGDLSQRQDAMRSIALGGGSNFIPYLSTIARFVNDPDPLVRANAIFAIHMQGYSNPTGVAEYYPAVAERLRDSDPEVRAHAVWAMEMMPGRGLTHAADVAQLLKDENATVRMRAATALGAMGELAADFAKDVAPLLNDPSNEVRDEAAKALKAINVKQP